jgi:hypothetical protein
MPLRIRLWMPNTNLRGIVRTCALRSHKYTSKKSGRKFQPKPLSERPRVGDAAAKISQVYPRFRVRSVQNWTRLQTNEFNCKVGQQRNNTQDRD